MEIRSTKDLEKNPKVNMLLYGPPGSGKTTIAGTFPKPLYLNIEAGVNTLMGEDIDFVDINEWEDVKEVYNALLEGDLEYESVIIDSVTELMKKRSLEIQGSRQSLRIQDWGTLIREIEEMMRRFRDLPHHVLFIFAEEENKVGDEMVKRPSVSGRTLSTTACGFVDIVGYTKVLKDKTIQFMTQLTPDEVVYAKSRFKNVKGDVENFTFELLRDLMKGGEVDEKKNPKIDKVLREEKNEKKESSKKKS
jgi:phage nucleotide-binding protein